MLMLAMTGRIIRGAVAVDQWSDELVKTAP